jgi:2-amino-4-hydroxy-6-hydroxymethyldihydropteridine diphosphokinase
MPEVHQLLASTNGLDLEIATAYIGLGSNLENPEAQIRSAQASIAKLEGVEEQAFSDLYQSIPMGPQDQPDYINAVMSVTTSLAPHELLRCLQDIENKQGRVRTGERWAARTLDLDLLIYGDKQIQTPDLTIPHPGLADRAFVLYPLYELTSELWVPGIGNIADLIKKCPLTGLKRIN